MRNRIPIPSRPRSVSPLARMGASYGQYFTSDLLNGKLAKKPKLCVMLHSESYTDEEKAQIVQTVGSESLLWVTMDGISTEKLREEARNHGVRLFTNTECNVWANGPFIVLHASKGDPVTVQLKDGTQKTLELKLGETRILRDADF
ncbi:MAG: hypothetical protein IJD43_11410 [Thermoguttaceae bacterium]|nr:hypothetical protein [Thermoguttaceae bacterium]